VVGNQHRPDGVIVSVSARPLDSTGGRPGTVAVFHDVTAGQISHANRAARGDLPRHSDTIVVHARPPHDSDGSVIEYHVAGRPSHVSEPCRVARASASAGTAVTTLDA
jgi:hypothetical protein